MINREIYEPSDHFFVRISNFPANFKYLDTSTENLLEASYQQFLIDLDLQEAIAVANPGLYKDLVHISSSCSFQKRKKLYFSLYKYILRSSFRCTPLGLFASLGMGKFDQKNQLKFHKHAIQKEITLSQEWIDFHIQSSYTQQEFTDNLRLTVNKLWLRRGKIWFLYHPLNIQNYSFLYHTEALSFIVESAQKPVIFRDLKVKLQEAFPSSKKAHSFILELLNKKFLISELYRPYYSLSHFLSVLDSLPDTEGKRQMLQVFEPLQKDLEKYQTSKEPISCLESIYNKVNAIKPVKYPIRINSSYTDHSMTLNSQIRDSLHKAAHLLVSLSKWSPVHRKTEQFHHWFLEKYGTDRMVSLNDLLHEPIVLNLLSASEGTPLFPEAVSQILCQHAEIDLEKMVPWLTQFSKEEEERAPPSMEIYFELISGHSEFQIHITGVSSQVGGAVGRFSHDSFQVNMLRDLLTQQEKSMGDHTLVEVSFLPEQLEYASLCPRGSFRKYQFKAYYDDNQECSIQDNEIYVGSDGKTMYLYSSQLKKKLHFVFPSVLNQQLAPIQIQILLLLSNLHLRMNTFFWEHPFSGEFFPRVRYQNIVFSPRRWHFSLASLGVHHKANAECIRKELSKTLEASQVPHLVVLTDSNTRTNQRLVVNRLIASSFEILVQTLLKNSEIFLTESFLRPDAFVIHDHQANGYASEFIFHVVKKAERVDSKAMTHGEQENSTSLLDRVCVPGDEWLYARIYLSEEELFISLYMRDFMHTLSNLYPSISWFYVRYQEAGMSQVRLRIKASKSVLLPRLFPDLTRWMASMMKEKVCCDFHLSCYEREIERYGGVDCIEIAEEFFFIDSLNCSEALHVRKLISEYVSFPIFASFGILNILSRFHDLSLDSFYGESSYFPDHQQLNAGLRAYCPNAIPIIYRVIFNHELVSTNPLIEVILKAFSQTWDVLDRYAIRIRSKSEVVKFNIVNSLIHMHCNRLLGCSRLSEEKARSAASYFLSRIRLSSRHKKNSTLKNLGKYDLFV